MGDWKKYCYIGFGLFILGGCQPADDSQIASTLKSETNNLFFPEMQTLKIDRLRISRHGAEPFAVFSLINGQWQMLKPYSIPANPELLEQLSRQFIQAKIIENKTTDPDWFKYLGLADIHSKAGRGSLIEIAAAEKTWRFISGDISQRQIGQYWRKAPALDQPGSIGAVRVDQVLDLPADIINWMERTIVDLPANGVAGIQLLTGDGKRIDLQRPEATAALKLKLAGNNDKDLPHSVQQLVFGLAQLNFDAIKKPVTDRADYHLRYRLFDNSEIELQIISADGDWSTGSWAQLKVLAPVRHSTEPEFEAKAQENMDLVMQMNQQLSRWSYHLSPQRTSLYIQAINEVFQ